LARMSGIGRDKETAREIALTLSKPETEIRAIHLRARAALRRRLISTDSPLCPRRHR
jgi:hypothetical protein